MKNKSKNYYVPVFYNHLIFLNEDERYSLYEGNEIEAIGSIYKSQLLYKKNDEIDLYSKETYLKYIINSKKNDECIQVFPNYYKIYVPLQNIDFEDDDIFSKNECFMEDILNEEDAGKKKIHFRYKKVYKNKSPNIVCIHSVEIKDISFFKESVCFAKY